MFSLRDCRFSHLFYRDSISGWLLILSAVLAMVIANSPYAYWYHWFLSLHLEFNLFHLSCDIQPVSCQQGERSYLQISKSTVHWINDGLMVFFFLFVALELKFEVMEGVLRQRSSIFLPLIAAVGGMLVPAFIYMLFNGHDSQLSRGWAIPVATDIAFVLAVLSLLGSRVPLSLKVFLTSLAIFDDIAAILIIAVFYTADISFSSLIVSLFCVFCLLLLNFFQVYERSVYFCVAGVMWVALLKSGVHATLTGVILALFIPLRVKSRPDYSPLKSLANDLRAMVMLICLPVFAFFNSGISFTNINLEALQHPVILGVGLGLVIGKLIGVYLFSSLAIFSGITEMPKGMNQLALFGASLLCGIGFTMSLFIGELAFIDMSYADKVFDQRLGVIVGSLISGVLGLIVLNYALDKVPSGAS